MAQQYENRDDGWCISDEVWSAMEPLLPPPEPHHLGCHRPRLDNRLVLNMIFLVLRTGMQWNALNAIGICSCTPVYQRFREWVDAGVFEQFWRQGLLEYDRLKGIDWDWLALDGAMMKAPWVGKKTGPNPTDRGKGGVKRSLLTEAHGLPIAIALDGANRHDMKLVEQTLSQLMIKRPEATHEKPAPVSGQRL